MEATAGTSGVKKKPMLDQICEAIKDLGKPRVGASVVAIKKHILETYEESNHGRIETQFKKAIAQGEESGLLVRPARCKNSVGATGSFLLKNEKVKSKIQKPQKDIDDKPKKVKNLHQPEDSKSVPKPVKPKTAKVKTTKKKEDDEHDNEDDFNHSTPKSSNSEVERKPMKPRALKKTLKDAEKETTFTLKKHSSESDLTHAQQKAAKRKNVKEKSKNTAKNNKPGTSDSLKETEKASQENVKKKARKTLKSYNSDSILMEKK